MAGGQVNAFLLFLPPFFFFFLNTHFILVAEKASSRLGETSQEEA